MRPLKWWRTASSARTSEWRARGNGGWIFEWTPDSTTSVKPAARGGAPAAKLWTK